MYDVKNDVIICVLHSSEVLNIYTLPIIDGVQFSQLAQSVYFRRVLSL
jgi:hypothetical protein